MSTSTVIQPYNPFAQLAAQVCAGLPSPHTRRCYGRHLQNYLASNLSLTRTAIQCYLRELRDRMTRPATCNQCLSALKKFTDEAHERGLIGRDDWAAIKSLKAAPSYGIRAGNWLTLEQCSALLNAPDIALLSGLRDRAILALLIGCGMRRSEVALLTWDKVQMRSGRWVICDLIGKKCRVRTIPVPGWAVRYLQAWQQALEGLGTPANGMSVQVGRVFWSIKGAILGDPLTESGVWWIVKEYSERAGLHFRPHDLRRTFAKLAREGGAEWEDIQTSLGHADLATTQMYVGKWLELGIGKAAGDKIKL